MNVLIVSNDDDQREKIIFCLQQITNDIIIESANSYIDAIYNLDKKDYAYDYLILDLSFPINLGEGNNKYMGNLLLRQLHSLKEWYTLDRSLILPKVIMNSSYPLERSPEDLICGYINGNSPDKELMVSMNKIINLKEKVLIK